MIISNLSQYNPPYTVAAAIIKIISSISKSLGRMSVLQKVRELRLRRINRIKTIQGTLAIEGNTLSEDQIQTILEGKPVVAPLREIQKGVSKYFDLPPFILQSWIHALTVFRNLCAHHARIWNRSLTIRPKLTRNMESHYPKKSIRRKRIALMIDIISELLKPLGKYEAFVNELNEILTLYPGVPVAPIGLNNKKIDVKKGVRQ